MSKEERDEKFWQMTDEYIQLANKQCDSERNGKVSTSLLFSAARFNAFMFASTSRDLADFQKDKAMAIEYFTNLYREALEENLNDYEKNYKDYISRSK
ncbi:MAG TPA: DUF3144 domain-containing protein [Gammaproteobacteria bacterium]